MRLCVFMVLEKLGYYMPIKVKVVSSRPANVAVRIKRAPWQQFISY